MLENRNAQTQTACMQGERLKAQAYIYTLFSETSFLFTLQIFDEHTLMCTHKNTEKETSILSAGAEINLTSL